MGPSGSGKTSLLRAMAGLWCTGRGKITFYVTAEENSKATTSSELTYLEKNMQNTNGLFQTPISKKSRSIFFLPQKPYMVLGTLRQQLLYPTWAEEIILPSDSKKPAGTCIAVKVTLPSELKENILD